MIRIRKKYKQIFLRILCCLLCAAAVMTAVLSVPVIARVIPDSVCGLIAAGVMKNEYKELLSGFTDRYVRPEYYAECVPVSLSAVLGYDYEEETQPVIPEGVEFVTARDLCGYTGSPQFLLSNQTNFTVETPDNEIPFSFPKGSREPVVLIIHTHGTESYLPEGVNYYTDKDTFRSTDINENVVSVGKVIADELNNAGITTVHDTTMYDESSYNSAYTNSRNAVKQWLAEYPSIMCVIDVHRDAIVTADGKNIKPFVNIDGTDTAQLMLVVGTDEAGAAHPDWYLNYSFAAQLQQKANERFPKLMRPLNLRRASFNQQLCSGFFLLEVGSCANTITEARAAASLFAQVFADTYYE